MWHPVNDTLVGDTCPYCILDLEFLKLFSYYTTLKHHFLKHFSCIQSSTTYIYWKLIKCHKRHRMAASVFWCEISQKYKLSCTKALTELVISLFGKCSKNHYQEKIIRYQSCDICILYVNSSWVFTSISFLPLYIIVCNIKFWKLTRM